ncbi:galactose mutarotase-like domain-containing protein [Lipomyces tetrasporus]|uniref:Alpha-mannosidase n=1 Tax=Lipomyces tetrasporus TaxID=54092 RepID=A0AAD7QWA2_9ASCO|nr:galactose mutarotase-like domain-containing protein [Lipomyces tetrasporus]KAJ8102643.1 galactose mutarotase-like domain-containing protein [Lipomyces tetrasporus]
MPSQSYPQLNNKPVAKKVRDIYKERINQFINEGPYKLFNLPAVLDDARVCDEEHVRLEVYSVPDLQRPHFKDAIKGTFRPTRKGESFGPSWSTHWFRIHVRIPKKDVWLNNKQLEFHWENHNEGLVYNTDGLPLQGLTGDDERPLWPIPNEWKDGEWHVFYIEASCNGMFGNGDRDQIQPPDPNRWFPLSNADLVAPCHDARALYLDFGIIADAARQLDQDSWESNVALKVCNDVMNVFDPDDKSTLKKCRAITKSYLGEAIDSPDVYESGQKTFVYAIGHCHIADTAWLWPYAETRRKTARSWASQIALIRQFPEHRFACSQAQQYKWLKDEYPGLFEEIKKEVKNGRFNFIGGSWVENDTNMPSGEALVRQMLLGQRFFESNFGERSVTYWLPDTFGYSPQVPQICRGAEMSRFLTQKLSWNNINNFPNSTFNWVALDGSQVLCHMPPADTYTSRVEFSEVSNSLRNHKNLEQDQTSLLVFGIGDGGGGPTAPMLEKLRRYRGLSDTVGLLPRVKMGHTADEYFDLLEKSTTNGEDLVTWVGELYFELHRGTYTTQSDIKKGNRRTEILLHDIEYLSTLATMYNSRFKYPTERIDDLWEIVLLNQFHDVLPGSAIEMVYDDAKELYAEVAEKGAQLVREAAEALGLSEEPTTSSELVAVSTLPWPRQEILALPRSALADDKGLSQVTVDNTQNQYVVMESTGSGLLKPVQGVQATAETSATVTESMSENMSVYVLENKKLRVTIKEGVITSLWDKDEDREVLVEGGKANQFVIFDDKPLYFQAWDTEVYSLDKRRYLSGAKVRIGETGPLRASVIIELKISDNSWLKSTISVDACITSASSAKVAEPITTLSYVDITTEVEWRENHKFLKVEFPVDVHSDVASYETQFGLVKRPTHFNTSWDVAKFEVCCHKWADLSEATYGVTIMNDSKYGFATHGNVQRLSLLRSPKAPDGHADMGHHFIKYAILPHKGSINSEIVRASYNYNYPVRTYFAPKKAIPSTDDILSSITVEGNTNIILSNVKRGEDDEDTSRGHLAVKAGKSIYLRVYDSIGGKTKAIISTTLPVKKVAWSNLLEDEKGEIKFETVKIDKKTVTKIPISLRAFEVSTVKIQLA